MKEKWLANIEQIVHELVAVISTRQHLFLYTEQEPDGLITTATRLCSYDGESYLLLQNDGSLRVGQRGLALYRRPGRELSRGFHLEVRRCTAKQVAVSLPRQIFKIQRRQHPRIMVPAQSLVHFFIGDSPIATTMAVEDLAMAGARFSGLPMAGLSTAIRLERLSLHLRRTLYRHDNFTISLGSAMVRRVQRSRRRPGEVEVVVCFQPSLVEEEQLTLYIESQLWQASLYGE